jgi:hypothetical protein
MFLSRTYCAHRILCQRAYKHMGSGNNRPTYGGTLTLLLWLFCDLTIQQDKQETSRFPLQVEQTHTAR